VCPAVTVSLAGCEVMASAVVPAPLREMPSGEFVASLAMVMPPLTLPGVVGAN